MIKAEYASAQIAIDAVIFTISDDSLNVFLHKREKEPFKHALELPGGLLLPNETAEQTLCRKIEEVVGTQDVFFEQFFTFSHPKRDPRGRVVSIGFVCLAPHFDSQHWFNLEKHKFAFDHGLIIQKAKVYLQERLSPSILKHFMPDLFPLNQLQKVYQIIEEKEYDNRNFRKKMISAGIVEETDQLETNVSHRPAKLFRFR